MEVHIDVLQKIEGEERLACSANFVMVARNKATGLSYEVPKLSLQREKEIFRIINELGQERQRVRKS
jgi:acyl-CoA hydrolase